MWGDLAGAHISCVFSGLLCCSAVWIDDFEIFIPQETAALQSMSAWFAEADTTRKLLLESIASERLSNRSLPVYRC